MFALAFNLEEHRHKLPKVLIWAIGPVRFVTALLSVSVGLPLQLESSVKGTTQEATLLPGLDHPLRHPRQTDLRNNVYLYLHAEAYPADQPTWNSRCPHFSGS